MPLKHLGLIIALWIGLVAPSFADDERVWICVSRGTTPPRDMGLYGVQSHVVSPEFDVDAFAGLVDTSQFVYASAKSGWVFQGLLEKKKNREALRRLLARGGTIYFDWATVQKKTQTREWLASIGVTPPPDQEGGLIDAVANPSVEHPLLAGTRHAGSSIVSYQYWTQVPEGLTTLLVERGQPQHAVLLLTENVLGHGRVLFSTAKDMWGKTTRSGNPLIESLLTSTFGPLPAPGRTTAVFDPYELRDPPANTACLINQAQGKWHEPTTEHRRIYLISEPIGMARRGAYVELEWSLPTGLKAESVTAYTVGGVKLPCQCVGDGRFAVNVPLRAYDDQVIHLYAGGSNSDELWGAYEREAWLVEQGRFGWLLRSDDVEAVLHPSRPALWSLREPGGSENFLVSEGRSTRWFGHGTDFLGMKRIREATCEVAVVEDGPVRKTLRYTATLDGKRLYFDFSIVRHGRALFFQVSLDEPWIGSLEMEDGWAPGGSTQHDSLWYEAAEGLKRLPFWMKPTPQYTVGKLAKETWHAVVDEQHGEVAGGFLERDDRGGFEFRTYCHIYQGHLILQRPAIPSNNLRGGWVARRGDAATLRDVYVEWRNPPRVTVGIEQRRDQAPQMKPPRFGEDFLLIGGGYRRHGGRTNRVGLDRFADLAMEYAAETGCNVINLGMRLDLEDWGPFVKEAHRRGYGVQLRTLQKRLGGAIEDHDAYLEATRFLGQYQPDVHYVLDEYAHNQTTEASRRDFKEKTGFDLPDKLDLSLLPDERTFAVIKWRMDVMTDLVREMDAIAKQYNPNAMTYVCTAPTQMEQVDALNDLEAWSPFISTTSSDLYSNSFDDVRFGMQYIRGAQGNHKPVMSIGGNSLDPYENASNFVLHLMNGTNAFWYFGSNWPSGRDLMTLCRREYEIMRDTGLGNVLAKARPMTYAAVLSERECLLEGIRRGEIKGHVSLYQQRVKHMAALRNVPTDIVFASHLAKDLPDYGVLIVTSGRPHSATTVSRIEQWVRGGGKAIICGQALLEPRFATLCGVRSVKEDAYIGGEVEGIGGPLRGIKAAAGSMVVKMTVGSARAQAKLDGGTVVALRRVGSGQAVAISLFDPPHALLRPLLLGLGGPLPARLDTETEHDIRLAAFAREGRIEAIGLYSQDGARARKGQVLFDEAPKSGWVNVHDGTTRPAGAAMSFHLPAKGWCFFVREDLAKTALPTAGPMPVSPIYASRPGMQFLKSKAKVTAAPSRRRKADHHYVAVFRSIAPPHKPSDYGASAIMNRLQQQRKVEAVWIESIDESSLADMDVIIVPNMQDPPPNLTRGWQQTVRKFVNRGGGALLIHHAVGKVTTVEPAFPEIATVKGFTLLRELKVSQDHPIVSGGAVAQRFKEDLNNPAYAEEIHRLRLEVGQRMISGFPDYMALAPSDKAQTLIVSERKGQVGGEPALVVGSFGRGRVVLSGMNLGADCQEKDGQFQTREALNAEEQAILINAVFWLAERE